MSGKLGTKVGGSYMSMTLVVTPKETGKLVRSYSVIRNP